MRLRVWSSRACLRVRFSIDLELSNSLLLISTSHAAKYRKNPKLKAPQAPLQLSYDRLLASPIAEVVGRPWNQPNVAKETRPPSRAPCPPPFTWMPSALKWLACLSTASGEPRAEITPAD